MKKIVLIGNAASAELMYAYLKSDTRYEVLAFSVHREYIKEPMLFGKPVVALESLAESFSSSEVSLLMAVGYGDLNRNRQKLYETVKGIGYTIETYIHPDAKVYTESVGEGSIIMPNAFVDVFCEIGVNAVIWGNCSVAHHAKVGNHCWLATGCVISGSAELGDNSFVGVGVTIVNQVKVGSHNIIGAGSLIFKDTGNYEVYISRQTEKFRLNAEDYLKFSKI